MRLKAFFKAPAGRLIAASSAFALMGAGVIAIVGPGSYASLVIPLIILVCVVGAIMGISLSTEEFASESIAMLLGFPPVGGLYFASMETFVLNGGLAVGALLIAIGLIPAWVSVRPPSVPQGVQAFKPAKNSVDPAPMTTAAA